MSILGPTEEGMKEITKWTRNTDMENTNGQTVVSTKDIGSMVNSMDKAITF